MINILWSTIIQNIIAANAQLHNKLAALHEQNFFGITNFFYCIFVLKCFKTILLKNYNITFLFNDWLPKSQKKKKKKRYGTREKKGRKQIVLLTNVEGPLRFQAPVI